MRFLLLLLMFGNAAVAQQWNDDLKEATREAAMSNKKVLLYFSVSDACEMCKTLEEKVFSSEEFLTFAGQNYILARPVFRENEPMETKADKLMIVEKYNKDGFFPLVVILDGTSRVLGKTGVYNGETASEFIRSLKSIGMR